MNESWQGGMIRQNESTVMHRNAHLLDSLKYSGSPCLKANLKIIKYIQFLFLNYKSRNLILHFHE